MADLTAGNIVPSLNYLANKAFIDGIISQASPATAEFIWKCADVWGVLMKYHNNFRKNCIVQLNEHCFTRNGQTPLDVCAVLDCVLDNTFTELEIKIPYHIIKSFSSLLSVIAHRSPQLKRLDITFCTNSSNSPQLEQPAIENSLKQPNSNLKYLTNLSIFHYHIDEFGVSIGGGDQPYLPILGIIAKRCPVLINLSVRGLRLCIKRDILELLLGDYMIHQLTPFDNSLWSNDGVMNGYFRIPKEFLTPLCSTLQKIELLCLCSTSDCSYFRYADYHIVLQFAAVHVEELQFIQFGQSITSSSVKLLESIKRYRRSFDKVYREVAAFVGESNLIGFPTYLSGIFSRITKLVIRVDDIEIMRNVGSLCRQLKRVEFVGILPGRLANITDNGNINSNYHADPSQHSPVADMTIGSILNNWPKVKAITFNSVHCAACITCILSALGPELDSLTLCGSGGYRDLSFLIPFTKLEKLNIYTFSNPLVLSGPPADLDSNEFLPNLKELESDVCLGKWSSLLESKPTLTTIWLRCCHIGTLSRSPALEWNKAPEFWPNMERLTLDQCTGLTMVVLSSLVPRLKYLEHIELPTSVRQSETEELVRDVVGGMMKSRKNLKEVSLCRTLSSGGSGERCSFQST